MCAQSPRESFGEIALQEDSHPRRTVLVVEDETLIRIYVADELRAAGYEVVEAGSGEEALGLLGSASDIDVILTDIRLGGTIDGYAVAAEFRKRHSRIKIVFVSG